MTTEMTTSLPDLADRITTQHEQAQTKARSAMEHALACGEALNQAKTVVPHGEWVSWLEANTPVSVRNAQRYMKVDANREKLKYDTGSFLTIKAALNQLASPKPKPKPVIVTEHVKADAGFKTIEVETTDPLPDTPALDQLYDIIESPKFPYGINEFTRLQYCKLESLLAPVIEKLSKRVTPSTLKDIATLMAYQSSLYEQRKVVEVAELLKIRTTGLDAKEKRLEKTAYELVERKRRMESRMPDDVRKLIRGRLHPDKAPADEKAKFEKAFQVFSEYF